MNTNEKIEKIEQEQFRNKLNDNLDKINSTLTNLNRILSVNLIFNLQGTDFIKKNKKEIDEVIPSYIEVLNAINKNIK
jgi:hypothetical protein